MSSSVNIRHMGKLNDHTYTPEGGSDLLAKQELGVLRVYESSVGPYISITLGPRGSWQAIRLSVPQVENLRDQLTRFLEGNEA